jgi:hypothetical protein
LNVFAPKNIWLGEVCTTVDICKWKEFFQERHARFAIKYTVPKDLHVSLFVTASGWPHL